MVRALRELSGFQIDATDGLIGHLTGVYFDDVQWAVRYLVVDTGGWLDAREVLISPTTLGAGDGWTRTFASQLTKQQVEDSPSIDLAKPVSREHEAAVADHYGWPAYWNAPLWASVVPATIAAMRGPEIRPVPAREAREPHLRSSREVIGYHLRATDDTLGHVEDLVIDDDWLVRYLAIDTSNWWFGGHALISPRWITGVRWPERVVDLGVTRDVVKHSPTWTPTYPITREYEDNLRAYYQLRQSSSDDRRFAETPLDSSLPRS